MENEKDVYIEKRRNDVEFIKDKRLRVNSTVIQKNLSKKKYRILLISTQSIFGSVFGQKFSIFFKTKYFQF